MDTKDLIQEELNTLLKELRTEQPGTDGYNEKLTDINKLTGMLNEMEKIQIDKGRLENECANIIIEKNKLKSEDTDRKTKNLIAKWSLGATIAGGVCLSIWEARGGLVSSNIGRKISDKIFKGKY